MGYFDNAPRLVSEAFLSSPGDWEVCGSEVGNLTRNIGDVALQ